MSKSGPSLLTQPIQVAIAMIVAEFQMIILSLRHILRDGGFLALRHVCKRRRLFPPTEADRVYRTVGEVGAREDLLARDLR